MIKFVDRFEKIVSRTLLVFAMVIIIYQVVQLIYNSIQVLANRFKEYGLQYTPEYARNIAVLFFSIILMMEIMQTLKVFSYKHIIKVRIILIVCLIAASQKVLALGEHAVNPMEVFALAGLILALASGYFLVTRQTRDDEHLEEEGELKE